MKTYSLFAAALTLLVCGFCAQAHEFDPGGWIVITCSSLRAPRMADVAHAVAVSHYWAPQSARREMLDRARQECARGGAVATFVPPADQRYRFTTVRGPA